MPDYHESEHRPIPETMKNAHKKRVLILHSTPSPQRAALFNKLGDAEVDYVLGYWRRAGKYLSATRIHDIYHDYQFVFFAPQWAERSGLVGRLSACFLLLHLVHSEYDAIVGCGYTEPCSWAAFFWCQLARIPFVHTGGSTKESQRHPARGLYSALKRLMVRHSSAVIAYSCEAAELAFVLGAHPSRTFNAYIGVDVEWAQKRIIEYRAHRDETKERLGLEKQYYILHAGRLLPRKGVMELLDAFMLLRRSRDDVGLLFVGTGELEEELQRRSEDLPPGEVVIIPAVDYEKLMEIYAAVDVFALLSWREPSANAVSEALAAGLPVVATPYCGNIRERVISGENGFLVDPKNTSQVAARLNEVLKPERSKRFGKRSRELAMTQTIGRSAQVYQHAVRAALGLGM